jgi:UDP-N-acetylglucosamine--N-acetylmuramyl-(pentapeptide) pyrophosphoryl-undecaprenol N-acetylglucosamine transferase
VPLPSASNNEQAENAKALLENSATLLINNSEIEEKFGNAVLSVINDDAKMEAMSRSAKSLARPNASIDTANEILKVINKNN